MIWVCTVFPNKSFYINPLTLGMNVTPDKHKMCLSVILFLKDTRKINFQFLSSIVVTLVFQVYRNDPKFSDRSMWANSAESADPDHQTAPTGAV